MTFLNFIRFPENERTDSFSVEHESRNLKAMVHIPRNLDGHQYLSTTALKTTLADFTEKAPVMLKPHSESGWKDVTRPL